ncbi:hypothetical protein GCM10009628_05250 [Paeniglutamicibacter kerguelensis]
MGGNGFSLEESLKASSPDTSVGGFPAAYFGIRPMMVRGWTGSWDTGFCVVMVTAYRIGSLRSGWKVCVYADGTHKPM